MGKGPETVAIKSRLLNETRNLWKWNKIMGDMALTKWQIEKFWYNRIDFKENFVSWKEDMSIDNIWKIVQM